MSTSIPLFSARFLFVRHGESVANAARLFAGQMDVALTEQGKRDAEEAARWLAHEEIGTLYASPLQRVWQTAAPIAAAKGGMEIRPVEGIIERTYGEWEGKPTGDYDRGAKPPGGESPEEFNARTIEALQALSGGPPILIVAHSGTFRALRGYLCGIDTTYDTLKNGRPVAFTPPASGAGPWTVELVGAPHEDLFLPRT
jgi:probable phosphoglycerate mutase